MIVSCPSCESKYQVADDKVAGSMLRTRCKACGTSMVVDGTMPPAAGDANTEEDDIARVKRAGDHMSGASAAPTGSRSKPPPPQRASMAAGAPLTSKPPPPQRRSQTGSYPVPSEKLGAGTSVSKRPVVDVNAPDALDPSAPSSDFYSKLLSKVSAPKTKSQPATASETTFNPRKTYPPAHEPFAPAADRAASHPIPARSDAFQSGLSAQQEGDAPPGDFYAKVLAKVRPQKIEPPAPQATAVQQISEHKTLQPPSWGALPQAQPAEMAPAASPLVATPAPIRVVPPAPEVPAAPAFNPKSTAIGLGEFEVHVDIPVDATESEAPERPSPAAAEGLSPVAPKPSEPPLAASIQLPPISSTTPDERPPTGIVVPGLASGSPPAAGVAAPAAARSESVAPSAKAEPTLEPSVKSMAAPASPALDPYTSQAQPKRFAWMIFTIIGVGLLGVGGGVAATIYALKPSLNAAAQVAAGSAPAAAAPMPSVVAAQPQQPAAASAPSQAAAPPDEKKASDEPEQKAADPSEKSTPKAVNNAAIARTPTPAAPPAEPRKEVARAPTESVPAGLDAKSAGKTINTKTALPPAPTPAPPSKGGGTGPFPKEVAQAMLGVAASQAPSCKKPGGPTGAGKAIVTFDTDGQVVITNVVGEGFAGTPTGQCVAALFRRVRVPPFAGDRATATKVFNIPP